MTAELNGDRKKYPRNFQTPKSRPEERLSDTPKDPKFPRPLVQPNQPLQVGVWLITRLQDNTFFPNREKSDRFLMFRG
jgi:hypothetical protein